ncbi:hypothetical protein B0T14DRAFT_565067 [Immersiella caudata]|uniref:Uncharacterized protein n=1 Tax=Immersiella caudata TaxID=314043 RepID=A0AA39WYM0_9PEZI|nr:hypothetical protein B0T14DRAFT_565067 [Immersiella caudata]
MKTRSAPARCGLRLLALSWLASAVSANNKLTSTPANFRGFRLHTNGAVETITCSDSATFFTSSTYAACCYPGERCNFATACESGTASRIFSGTYTCDPEFPDCYTMTVYASYPSADESWLMRGCATNWRASTIYREIVTSTSTSTTTSATAGASVPTTTPTATGTAAGAGGEPTGEPVASSSPSQAWIAGAVIGPLVALAILGAVAFWLGKRKGKKSAVQPMQSAQPPNGAAASMADRTSYYPVPGGPNGAAASYYHNGVPEGKPGFTHHDSPSSLSGTPSPAPTYGYPQPAQGPYSPPVQYPAQFAGPQLGKPEYPPQFQQPPQYPVQPPAQLPAQLQGSEVFPNPAHAAELPHDPSHR